MSYEDRSVVTLLPQLFRQLVIATTCRTTAAFANATLRATGRGSSL